MLAAGVGGSDSLGGVSSSLPVWSPEETFPSLRREEEEEEEEEEEAGGACE